MRQQVFEDTLKRIVDDIQKTDALVDKDDPKAMLHGLRASSYMALASRIEKLAMEALKRP